MIFLKTALEVFFMEDLRNIIKTFSYHVHLNINQIDTTWVNINLWHLKLVSYAHCWCYKRQWRSTSKRREYLTNLTNLTVVRKCHDRTGNIDTTTKSVLKSSNMMVGIRLSSYKRKITAQLQSRSILELVLKFITNHTITRYTKKRHLAKRDW